MYAGGEGVDPDMEQAAEFYRRACGRVRRGDGESCFRLAGMYQSGTGVEQSNREAERYYNLACWNGYRAGCFPPPLTSSDST